MKSKTKIEKKILKNGPDFAKIIAEIMFYKQCCSHQAMVSLIVVLSETLATTNKAETLLLLQSLHSYLSRPKRKKTRRQK